MGVNPMQKMKRNSMLSGLMIGLMIGLILCACVYVFVGGNNKKTNSIPRVKAYVLGRDVSSGQIITPDMLTQIEVYENMVPINYIDNRLLETITMQDDSGNILYTNTNGELYMVMQNSGHYKKTADGNVIIEKEADGRFFRTNMATNQKEYLTIKKTPLIAKINLKSNSIITSDMITKSNTPINNDLRKQEYNMLVLPTNLSKGEFIDVRLQLPTGGDYIVVSKKEVIDCNAKTIWLNMYEEEIELMSNAIIEYYIMAGSKLYVTTYTDPGIQTAAIGTYVPNKIVSDLISNNPNIKNYINSDRYLLQSLKDIRNNYINAAVNSYNDKAIDNIEANIKEEIKSLKESREAYFAGLPTAN